MVKRKIVKINELKCNGCGQCIPNCPEGALQVIDGKARVVSDIFCDGLGACIGYCPQGAITIEARDAEEYDEKKTMKNIVKAGKNTIIAHLKHLDDHNEKELLDQALEYLEENNIKVDFKAKSADSCIDHIDSCPGTNVKYHPIEKTIENDEIGIRSSQLRQWPVQLTLIPPFAPYFQGKDVLLVADCVAYTIADFHKDYLKGRSIAIACPKLDSNLDMYLDKLVKLIDGAKINTLTVMTMEVPCCNGLLGLAKNASEGAKRKVPIKSIVVGLKGDILNEEWI